MSKTKSKKTKWETDIVNPDDLVTEDNDNEDNGDEGGTGGIMLGKEDIQLIHKSLSLYKPTRDEEHLHSILLEQFEELLETDYIEIPTK